MIILIGGEKGGVGKTTLAVNLATLRARGGREILLVDADKQASANLWAGIRLEAGLRPRIPCIQKLGKTVGPEVRDLASKYQDVIIDAGGRDSAELRSALTVARLAVFPLRASLFDAATLENLDTLVETAQAFNPELVAGVLINLGSPHPQVREVDEAKELVETYAHLQLFRTVVRDRIVFRKSVRDGLTASEFTPRDASAVREMDLFYEEVFGDD